MFCENCGAELSSNASYCEKCGWERKNPMQKYRYIIIALALGCLALLIALVALLIKSGAKADSLGENSVELCGIYTVGEDDELPAGRYNIKAIKGEKRMDVNVVYPNAAEDLAGEETDDYEWDWLHGESVTGYKLREGTIVSINEPGAIFEKID